MHGMSRRVLILAKRDFIATVFTKPFIFVLLLFPLLFGGGFLVNALMQSRANQQIRRVAIMDRTGVAAAAVIQAAEEKNQRDLYDKLTGRQAMAATNSRWLRQRPAARRNSASYCPSGSFGAKSMPSSR